MIVPLSWFSLRWGWMSNFPSEKGKNLSPIAICLGGDSLFLFMHKLKNAMVLNFILVMFAVTKISQILFSWLGNINQEQIWSDWNNNYHTYTQMLIGKLFINLENFPPNKQEIGCKSCYFCSVPWFFPLNYKTVTII